MNFGMVDREKYERIQEKQKTLILETGNSIINIRNYMTCSRCGKVGHTVKYYWRSAATTPTNTRVSTNGNRACFECRVVGHFKRDCLKLENTGGECQMKGIHDWCKRRNPGPICDDWYVSCQRSVSPTSKDQWSVPPAARIQLLLEDWLKKQDTINFEY